MKNVKNHFLVFLATAIATLGIANAASAQLPTVVRILLKPSVACAPASEKDARCNCRTLQQKIIDDLKGRNQDCKMKPETK